MVKIIEAGVKNKGNTNNTYTNRRKKMKTIKRFLGLGFILALVMAIVTPAAAFAAPADTDVTGAMPVGALHHFVFGTISSPQTAGTAFSITVTAKDKAGNTVTGFTGTVDLTETGGGAGGTVSPATTGSFTSGTITLNATLTKAGTLVTITATDHAGTKTGTSNTFTVNSGAVTAAQSTVSASPTSVPRDGTTNSTITVTLKDANGNVVSGKTVTLAQALTGGGTSHSTISAASGASDSNGVVTFTVHSLVAESVTYTATNTTDSITITQTAEVIFADPTLGVNAPSAVSLTLVNAPATDQQITNNSTSAGSVTALGLGTITYTASVSGSPVYLTNGSEHLNNALRIVTGDSSNTSAQLKGSGTWANAAGATTGDYSGTDAGYFAAVTGSSQTIGTGLSAASTPLSLYVFQKVDADESHIVGNYTLTLTYSVGADF